MNVEAPGPPPVGYDQIIGRPLELLGGLLVLAPLYGTPAQVGRF